MRKIYFVFGAVVSMALASGMVACSGDDDDNTVTPGNDGGSGSDAPITVTDSGPGKDGSTPTEAGACATCSQILSKGLASAGTPCDTALPLVLKLVDCTCAKDPLTMKATDGGYCDVDSGTGACGDLCANPTSTVPSGACNSCAADQCTAELAACAADGNDGGITSPDAGDGGDGG